MPSPVILVNNTGGSDTAASGAGPGTALSGTTNASTNGTGLIVTLPSGTVLTGVAVDGSHAIFLLDTTAGARNFGKIMASAGSGGATPTVTVANAFGASLASKSWAIGGKRASIGSTTSAKLFENNAAAGDAMPGWAVELQSGHVETIAAPLVFRRNGDTTDGPITLRGSAGAATRPVLTFSNSGKAIDLTSAVLKYAVVRDLELRNTNATKTGSTAVDVGSSNYDNRALVIGVKAAHATNYFNRGCIPGEHSQVVGCEFGYCATTGIDGVANAFSACNGVVIAYNDCHHCGSHGINMNVAGGSVGLPVVGNRSWSNGGDGLHLITAQGDLVAANTCHGNTGHGFWIDLGSTAVVVNNIASNNGGYGFHFNGLAAAALGMMLVRDNDTYANTSGAYQVSGIATDDPAADPNYVAAASGDFTPQNVALQSGYP